MENKTKSVVVSKSLEESELTDNAETAKGQTLPQVEIIPGEKFTKLLDQFAQKPFYLTPSFYVSLLALCISLTALVLSYMTSPISTYTNPKIEYSYTSQTLGKPTDSFYRTSMIGHIINRSRYSVNDLFVSTLFLAKKPAHIVVSGGIKFTIENNDGISALIKFPLFPPYYECIIIVEGIPKVPPEKLDHKIPIINSVYSKHGYGVYREMEKR